MRRIVAPLTSYLDYYVVICGIYCLSYVAVLITEVQLSLKLKINLIDKGNGIDILLLCMDNPWLN
jgi:hypothetical protein